MPQTAFLPTSVFPDWEVPDWEAPDWEALEPSSLQEPERPSATILEGAEHPVRHFQALTEIDAREEHSQLGHVLIGLRNKKSPSRRESPVQAKEKKSKSKAKPSKKDTASKKVTASLEPLPLSRAIKKVPSQPNLDLQTPIESELQLENRHEDSEIRVPFSAPIPELEITEVQDIQETEFNASATTIDGNTAKRMF